MKVLKREDLKDGMRVHVDYCTGDFSIAPLDLYHDRYSDGTVRFYDGHLRIDFDREDWQQRFILVHLDKNFRITSLETSFEDILKDIFINNAQYTYDEFQQKFNSVKS